MSDSTSFSHICSRALSRPVFTALAKGADPLKILAPLLEKLAEREVRSVAGVLELAFSHLSNHHRNEYVYKSAVIDRIVFGRHSPATSAVGMELHVGKSIVDIAVFNGTSTAYEVKSELDSPRRLTSQTADYLKAFDKVYVVAPRNNAHRYVSFCDQRVGIMELNERGSLRTVREAASNIHNIDTRALFRMLRRDEYVGAIEKHLGQKISLPNGLVSQYCETSPLGKEIFCPRCFSMAPTYSSRRSILNRARVSILWILLAASRTVRRDPLSLSSMIPTRWSQNDTYRCALLRGATTYTLSKALR